MNTVEYVTVAGQRFPVGSIGRDDMRFRIQNTTEDECREYAAALEKADFREMDKKEIPAGSECHYNVNLFYVFTNGEKQAFVFWDASIHTTFITVEPSVPLPNKRLFSGEKQVSSLSFTQLRLSWGMCYIASLFSGEFIIIDGGKNNEEDAVRLYDFLKNNSPNPKPTVALWIFTHSHKDHIGLATFFFGKYKDEISVRAFAYQFPDCDKISVSMDSVSDMKKEIEALEKNIETGYPDAVVYTMHTGQSYFFDGVEIEVLWTIDDTYPSFYTSFNDMSAAIRLKFASGKTVLLLADCQHEANRRLAHRYGDYLKSDMMQVAHHGLIGGDKGLYKLVDPEICFWPTTEFVFSGKDTDRRYRWSLGEGGCDYNAYLRDDSIRKRIHYHAGETVTVKI